MNLSDNEIKSEEKVSSLKANEIRFLLDRINWLSNSNITDIEEQVVEKLERMLEGGN